MRTPSVLRIALLVIVACTRPPEPPAASLAGAPLADVRAFREAARLAIAELEAKHYEAAAADFDRALVYSPGDDEMLYLGALASAPR
jgi:hypothetical protein